MAVINYALKENLSPLNIANDLFVGKTNNYKIIREISNGSCGILYELGFATFLA